MSDQLQNVSTVFLGIFFEALPFLLLGVTISAAMQYLVSDAVLARLTRGHPIASTVVGAVLGIPFPVCECGVIPVGRRLLSKGAPMPLALAFVLAAPVVNPIVAASTWVAFSGDPLLVFGRLGLAFGLALAVVFVFSLHPVPVELLAKPRTVAEHVHSPVIGNPIGNFVRHSADEFLEMGRYLVVGALIAASLQTFIPRAALFAVGENAVWSVAAAMALAALLSVCSAVDAFVALSFTGVFPPGALLAFLTFGPLVNMKSLALYPTILRRRPIALLLLLCAQIIFLAGVAANSRADA